MCIYCMQVQTCPVWNWYGIVEFYLRLQFYSIPFLIETPSLAFSTHSLLKVPNSRIIPTLTFQFQSPSTYIYTLVSVPDPKPTPVWIAFSIARGEGLGLYWKRYTRRMRSGDETIYTVAPHGSSAIQCFQ